MPLPPLVADLSGFDLLLSVARLGSVGRAAAEHGVSQPAASAKLRELERRLGLTLLHRTPHGSTTSEAGALIADWACAAIDTADALAAGVAALGVHHERRLVVTATPTVAEYLLPAWLVALRATHPALAVTLRAANSAEVVTAVLGGEAAIGFVEGPEVPAGLAAETVASDKLTVVVAPGHPWTTRRRGVTAVELAATPLVAREAGAGIRRALEELLPGPPATPLVELCSTTAIKHAVAAGSGPAVLSSLAVTTELAAGTLVAVPTSVAMERRLRAVWPAHAQLVGPAGDLYAIARRFPYSRRPR